jgi:hypothetical protein
MYDEKYTRRQGQQIITHVEIEPIRHPRSKGSGQHQRSKPHFQHHPVPSPCQSRVEIFGASYSEPKGKARGVDKGLDIFNYTWPQSLLLEKWRESRAVLQENQKSIEPIMQERTYPCRSSSTSSVSDIRSNFAWIPWTHRSTP